jgi:uncharacterized protein (DUF1778 family)
MTDRDSCRDATDVTEFVLGSAVETAQRVVADRDCFELDLAAAGAWNAMNAQPARELPGLRRLMERQSPWTRLGDSVEDPWLVLAGFAAEDISARPGEIDSVIYGSSNLNTR